MDWGSDQPSAGLVLQTASVAAAEQVGHLPPPAVTRDSCAFCSHVLRFPAHMARVVPGRPDPSPWGVWGPWLGIPSSSPLPHALCRCAPHTPEMGTLGKDGATSKTAALETFAIKSLGVTAASAVFVPSTTHREVCWKGHVSENTLPGGEDAGWSL